MTPATSKIGKGIVKTLSLKYSKGQTGSSKDITMGTLTIPQLRVIKYVQKTFKNLKISDSERSKLANLEEIVVSNIVGKHFNDVPLVDLQYIKAAICPDGCERFPEEDSATCKNLIFTKEEVMEMGGITHEWKFRMHPQYLSLGQDFSNFSYGRFPKKLVRKIRKLDKCLGIKRRE